MPLMVQHLRNNHPITYNWGMWHTQMFVETAAIDAGVVNNPEDLKNWNDSPVWSKGTYTYKAAYTCEDPSDGEVLTIEVGDTVRMWYGYGGQG